MARTFPTPRHLLVAACATSFCLIGPPANAQVAAQMYGETESPSDTFKVYLTFEDAVSALEPADFSVTNGQVVSTSGEGRFHEAVVTAQTPGAVSVSLSAGAGQSAGGAVAASNTFSVTANFDPEVVLWTIDSDADWADNATNSGFNFGDGLATTTGATASFTSAVRGFETPMKPEKITFRQSAKWDNWTQIPNLAPPGAGDAPVFLPVANDDYYFFGNSGGGRGQYHAWHSTDLQTWEALGAFVGAFEGPEPPLLPGPNGPRRHPGRWMTSAEYKDGMFYMLIDYPNDHTPALWIDDNLRDDIPARSMGTVFDSGASGSDASLFRNDADGLFHLIYEDWSPIDASTHAWDSPLGGHTSSPDGISGFVPHKHAPVIDNRTTPTGVIATYNHPFITPAQVSYEVHEPPQEAYGDWTTIKVGSQIYYFADYDPVGQNIRLIIFSTPSIYETAERVHVMHNGHPDPTVGFAEGQFYLLTQQAQDYVSPGPWVSEVQARAGVDTDGDGEIDQWTDWQVVEESYDHKAGYARVVTRSPAELDLSALPEGLGFQFEFQVDDQVAGASTPILDRVDMQLRPVPQPEPPQPVEPPAPSATEMPAMPSATGMPAMPSATGMPAMPSATGVPAMPSAMGMPAMPSAPEGAPGMPEPTTMVPAAEPPVSTIPVAPAESMTALPAEPSVPGVGSPTGGPVLRPSSAEGGCGCRVGGASSPGGAGTPWLGAFALGALLTLRRRKGGSASDASGGFEAMG